MLLSFLFLVSVFLFLRDLRVLRGSNLFLRRGYHHRIPEGQRRRKNYRAVSRISVGSENRDSSTRGEMVCCASTPPPGSDRGWNLAPLFLSWLHGFLRGSSSDRVTSELFEESAQVGQEVASNSPLCRPFGCGRRVRCVLLWLHSSRRKRFDHRTENTELHRG